ncbi:hypothetical protein DFH09DRAFT_1185056 [Mycena vulgaris]|nr:hypothetical protein DFH09DRAFT_1185056 [Mycena vulgaris]
MIHSSFPCPVRCDASPTPLHGPDTSTAQSHLRPRRPLYSVPPQGYHCRRHAILASSWRAHPCASQAARRVSSSTGHDRPPSHPSYDSHVRLTSPTPSSAASVSGVLQRSLHHVPRLPAAPAAISSARTPPAMRREPTYRLHTAPDALRPCDAGAPARRRRLHCVPAHPDSLPSIPPRRSQPTSAVHRKPRCATSAPYPVSAASVPLQPRPLPRLPALCDPPLQNSARTRSTLGHRPP